MQLGPGLKGAEMFEAQPPSVADPGPLPWTALVNLLFHLCLPQFRSLRPGALPEVHQPGER